MNEQPGVEQQQSLLRARRKRIIMTWTASVLVVVTALSAWWFLVDEEPSAPTATSEEWVRVGTEAEIRDQYVVYSEDHEVFVFTLAEEPHEMVALSAWSPTPGPNEERRRMLYCTLSNLFESEHGEVFDRTGHPLEDGKFEKMSRVDLRVRDGIVEVAPGRVSTNDLDLFGGPHGPPCGEWGEVVEGTPGFALATEAPAGENKASLDPARVQVGQDAQLHFAPGRPTSGLKWDLYRSEENGWRWCGIFVGGPGYDSFFDVAPLENRGSKTSASGASTRSI